VNVEFTARRRPDITLEGRLIDNDGPPCVVSHPHPLAGGDMDHPVVAALWAAAGRAGYRTLRYNFRGVGNSTGGLTRHSPLAIGDLEGAIEFLGGGPVLAIGYSYGARTTLHAIHAGVAIERAALVGLPTRLPGNRAAMSNLLLGRPVRTEQYIDTPDLDLVADAPRPVQVFAGDHDPLVQAAELAGRGVEPVLIEGVNHFFARRLGNQPPDPHDLEKLSGAVLGFLGADSV
jgi:alpha/beta superfamily hydrolase